MATEMKSASLSVSVDAMILPRGYVADKPEPDPAVEITSKLKGEALKSAVAYAMVDVLKGQPGRLRETAKAVLGMLGVPLSIEAMAALVYEIHCEWLRGEGPDVPVWKPPPEQEKPAPEIEP